MFAFWILVIISVISNSRYSLYLEHFICFLFTRRNCSSNVFSVNLFVINDFDWCPKNSYSVFWNVRFRWKLKQSPIQNHDSISEKFTTETIVYKFKYRELQDFYLQCSHFSFTLGKLSNILSHRQNLTNRYLCKWSHCNWCTVQEHLHESRSSETNCMTEFTDHLLTASSIKI